jgi:hypothetical protein
MITTSKRTDPMQTGRGERRRSQADGTAIAGASEVLAITPTVTKVIEPPVMVLVLEDLRDRPGREARPKL